VNPWLKILVLRVYKSIQSYFRTVILFVLSNRRLLSPITDRTTVKLFNLFNSRNQECIRLKPDNALDLLSSYQYKYKLGNKQMQPSLWSLGFLICMALTGIQPAFANSGLLNSTTSSASNLPLDGTNSSTTHIVKISTLALSTNSSKGFTVTISSGT